MKLLKRVFLFTSLVIAVTLTLCGCSLNGKEKEISIENDRVMYVGQKYTPVAKVENGKASEVEWSIDNESIAKLENGQIFVITEGSFNLIAKLGSAMDVKHIYTHTAEKFSITYELNGGSQVNNPEVYTEVSEKMKLNSPSKTGYTFAGFYLNPEFEGEVVEFIDGSFAGDITLYAKWTLNEVAMSYELNGGTCEELPATRTIETAEFVLPTPSKEGYEFAGWYANETFSGNQITALNASNISVSKLYAKFATEAYTITYDLAGGECSSNPAYYTVEDEITFAEPTKAGYTFTGWKLGEEVVTGIEQGSKGNITLVATWEIISYPISFELNGGLYLGLPTSRTIESEEFVLPVVPKEGYKFLGWYTTSDFSGEAVTALNSTNLTITTLYAKFEIILNAFIGEQGYPTIAEALAAAKDGDVITVKAGTYAEELTIDKAVTIEGPEKVSLVMMHLVLIEI